MSFALLQCGGGADDNHDDDTGYDADDDAYDDYDNKMIPVSLH